MNKAKFVKEITVTDPDTGGDVEVAIYKHQNGGMFGVDSSFIEQYLDNEVAVIQDPLNQFRSNVRLIDIWRSNKIILSL